MVRFDAAHAQDPLTGIEMARSLVASMTPAATLPGPDPEVSWHATTADAVGGDFLDVLRGPHKEIYVLIGDVSGTGALAAFLMSMTNCLFRILADEGLAPGQALTLANQILEPHLKRRGVVITAQLACYRPATRQLALASAGHPWPYMMNDRGFEELPLTGLPLGAVPDGDYPEIHEIVNPGHRLVFYTDGLVECASPEGEMFGFERLTQALAGARVTSAALICQHVVGQFQSFVGAGRRRDDVSVVAVAWS